MQQISSLFKQACFENNCLQQGFPQVMRTWTGGGGDSSKFDGGNLSQYMGEAGGA